MSFSGKGPAIVPVASMMSRIGLAGALVAIVVGLLGMVLGGLALARSRRTAAPPRG
jgi:hypothetical protein